MHKLAKWLCLLLFALPLMARADPFEVTTRTSGTVQTDKQILAWLGLPVPANPQSVPFDLTIRTVMDPQAPSFDGTLGYWLAQKNDAQVEVTLALGSLTYHYAGLGSAIVSGYQDTYRQHVTLPLPGHPSGLLIFQNDAGVDGVNFSQYSPLTPPALANAAPAWGYGTVDGVDDTTARDPDQVYASSSGKASTFSIAAVPEPAQAALLAAGMIMLLLARLARSMCTRSMSRRARRAATTSTP